MIQMTWQNSLKAPVLTAAPSLILLSESSQDKYKCLACYSYTSPTGTWHFPTTRGSFVIGSNSPRAIL